MNGKPFVDGPVLLPPTGVTARQSTDAYAIRDEDIVAAAHFIEQNATRGIQIADIVANVPISRRSLQSRFAKAFGRTVAEEILSKKLKHAQFLLMNTDLPLDQVAAQSGLVRAERLCNLFQKHLKTTPRQFRIRNRAQL
jgi:LacI family transcriptional regulator